MAQTLSREICLDCEYNKLEICVYNEINSSRRKSFVPMLAYLLKESKLFPYRQLCRGVYYGRGVQSSSYISGMIMQGNKYYNIILP